GPPPSAPLFPYTTLFRSDRLSGSIDVYDKKTSDLRLLRALPDVTGFFNVASNLGGVTNKGLEIALSSLNIDQENFSWRSSATFSDRKSTRLNSSHVKISY